MFLKEKKIIPDYRVRTSQRAKRILIKVLPDGLVEVVLPKGASKAQVPQVLQARSEWLTATIQKVLQHSKLNPHSHSLQPALIELDAIQQKWAVEYRPGQQKITVDKARQRLILPAGDSPQQTAARLRQWLQRYAKEVLPNWLIQVQHETGHRLNKISVRGQKTRWGSYSSAGNINLNRNLLFIHADTVRYLFVHELSHSVHMNHSRAFWQEVEKHQLDYSQHEKVLREQARNLPIWVYA